MSHTAYSQHYYNCEAEGIEVYFEYNNSVVFDTGKKTINSGGMRRVWCKELSVITECELEQYAGPSETHRYSRADNLVIQGIITFFTGIPLTVYHSNGGFGGITPIEYEKQEIHLKIGDVDYTRDLMILLDKLNKEPELIITLLDRWRKAIYLKEESCDADLYYDEATLSFFHIFELFGDSINKELKQKLENNIADMLYHHFQSYYFESTQIRQLVEQNKKAVNRLLIGDYLSLAVKIKYFLEKYELLDDNVAFFVDNMIKVRNAIAHGRITYQKAFMWPLSPFFSLAKDSYENIEFLFFLTVEMISKYIGISCWEEEWNEAKEFLMPPNRIISDFLENSLVIENFNYDMLVKGNQYNITWRTLFNYYVKKPKKAIRESMEATLKDTFMNTPTDEENAPDIFNISIIFADSEDNDIKRKAIENVKTIISNNWYAWSNFKDVYTYLEFYSVTVVWYKEFLLKRDYIECRNQKTERSVMDE